MKWKATIEKIDNGYILEAVDGEGPRKMVYKIKDEQDDTNKDHVIDMLYDMLEFFGEYGSKHNKRSIKICYIRGDAFTKEEVQKGVDFDVIEF